MQLARDPGELEVDWAGDTMAFVDPVTGELMKGWLFVATLAHSAYTCVEAFADMTLPSWIQGHVNAFEFFGGLTRLLVPDDHADQVRGSTRTAQPSTHQGEVRRRWGTVALIDILKEAVLRTDCLNQISAVAGSAARCRSRYWPSG